MKTSYNECIINQGTYSWVKRLAVGKIDFYVLKTFLRTVQLVVAYRYSNCPNHCDLRHESQGILSAWYSESSLNNPLVQRKGVWCIVFDFKCSLIRPYIDY